MLFKELIDGLSSDISIDNAKKLLGSYIKEYPEIKKNEAEFFLQHSCRSWQ